MLWFNYFWSNFATVLSFMCTFAFDFVVTGRILLTFNG